MYIYIYLFNFHIVNFVNMSQQNPSDFYRLKVPRIQYPMDAQKPAAFGMPKVSFKKTYSKLIASKNRNHLDVNDIKISHLLTTLVSWMIHQGPRLPPTPEVGLCSTHLAADTMKNTQSRQFFGLPNVHICEFIKTTDKKKHIQINRLKFCLISTLAPWRPPWKSPWYLADAAT